MDRSPEWEINKGSSSAVELFKTYANKMFKGFLQGSKDKHMQSFFLKNYLPEAVNSNTQHGSVKKYKR